MTSIPSLTEPPFADYESGEPKVGVFSRLFPSAGFYFRVGKAVFSASNKARKGLFDEKAWYDASLTVRDAFEKSGARIHVLGTEHIARLKEPCVIIGNHMSTAETFLMASMILPFRPVTFVIKQSLVEYPVFKHVMLSRDPIIVGRVNPREDLKAVLGGGREHLDSGTSIVIFPQRTRTVDFDRNAFNSIGVKLAKRAGVPIVPLALKTNAWSNGKWLKDYGRFQPHEDVHFEFGEPFNIEGSDKDAHERVIEFIEGRLKQWTAT